MKHYIFHLGFLVSESVTEDGETIVQDAGKRHFDVHVHAPDLEAAAKMMGQKVQDLLSDDGETVDTDGPYIGPF